TRMRCDIDEPSSFRERTPPSGPRASIAPDSCRPSSEGSGEPAVTVYERAGDDRRPSGQIGVDERAETEVVAGAVFGGLSEPLVVGHEQTRALCPGHLHERAPRSDTQRRVPLVEPAFLPLGEFVVPNERDGVLQGTVAPPFQKWSISRS